MCKKKISNEASFRVQRKPGEHLVLVAVGSERLARLPLARKSQQCQNPETGLIRTHWLHWPAPLRSFQASRTLPRDTWLRAPHAYNLLK